MWPCKYLHFTLKAKEEPRRLVSRGLITDLLVMILASLWGMNCRGNRRGEKLS